MSKTKKRSKTKKKATVQTTQIPDVAKMVADKPIFEATLKENRFSFPNICCVCLGPAEESKRISAHRYQVELSIEIPYCKQCYHKLRPWPFGKKAVGVEFGHVIQILTLRFKNEVYYEMFIRSNPFSVLRGAIYS